MIRHRLAIFAVLTMGSTLFLSSTVSRGQTNSATKNQSGHTATPAPSATCAASQMPCMTQAEREAAAKGTAAARVAHPAPSPATGMVRTNAIPRVVKPMIVSL